MTKERPLITFMLIAYNQERFIAEAAQGAFSQTYSPLEIVLSDDCSFDCTFEIMQEMAMRYQGPHTIVLNRNDKNLGLIGHINRVMEFAKGELIVAAAGDDISLPERTEKLYDAYFASSFRAYSIFSNGFWIDEHGQKMNLMRKKPVLQEELTLENYAARAVPGFVNGCTHAWHRETFDYFGPLPEDVGAEDTIIPFRSALLGQIAYIHEPLVCYRRNINRLKAPDGIYSFKKYREAFVKQRIAHLAMYRCRLRDIEHYLTVSNSSNKQDLDHVREITVKQVVRIENMSKAIVNLWWDFIKLIVYHYYQRLWHLMKR